MEGIESNERTMKSQADTMRKSNRWLEASELYRHLIEKYPEEQTDWTVSFLMQCQRKLGLFDEAEGFAIRFLEKTPNAEKTRDALSWVLYQRDFRSFEPVLPQNEPKYLATAERILAISGKSAFSARVQTVMHVLKYLHGKENSNPALILKWGHRVQVEQLDEQPYRFRDNTGKETIAASLRETWFSICSKALFDSRQFPGCLSVCQEAMKMEPLHHGNEVWFKRRAALCKAEMGMLEEALVDLNALRVLKKDWFIAAEVAKVERRMGDSANALKTAISVAVGIDPMKVGLYQLVAELLLESGVTESAKILFETTIRIRQEKGWIVPESLRQYLVDPTPSRTIEYRTLLGEANRVLLQLAEDMQETREGRLSMIHQSGKSGMIKALDGITYFFPFSELREGKGELEVGEEFRFVPSVSIDRKTGRSGPMASQVRRIRKG